MKKELPKYFAVKRDLKNPLWQKYIDWLNEKYNISLFGIDLYYGFDGSCFCGTCFRDYVQLITLEYWNECVNEDDFRLKDYCIKCGLVYCMCKYYKQNSMEQRKIIGYELIETYPNSLPLNTKVYSDGLGQFITKSQMPLSILQSEEILGFKHWKPIYEEEKLEIKDWSNSSTNDSSTIWVKGKLTQEIIDKIKEVIK